MAWLVSFVWRRLIVNSDPFLFRRDGEAAGREPAPVHPQREGVS
jgi:hypothetical protein